MKLTISIDGGDVVNNLDRDSIGVGAGILVVETVNVCHEEEEVCVNHGGSDGGECVIVTKLDLRDGEGIVFVDNGDDAHVKKLVDGILSIDVA